MTEEAIFKYLEKHQNGKWKSFGTTIESIEWWDGVNPTEKNIIEEGVKVEQKIIDDTKYQRDRASSYPSWQDQMDLLYHGGVDALKAELKKTKDKYPKPT